MNVYPVYFSPIDKITTSEIITQFNQFLRKKSVSINEFSSSITRCSYNIIYELLKNPKTWNLQNDLGRKRLKLMYLWMNDEDCMSKITRSLRNQVKEQIRT